MAEWMSGVAPAPPMIEQIARMVPRPMYFVSTGQGEEQFFTREFYEIAGSSATLWELPDDAHISGIMTHGEEYRQRMNGFFDAHLATQKS